MTNQQHPLTDDFCYRISETFPPDAAERNNMRLAADWQLEQVLKWLDENLSDYTDDEYRDDCAPLYKVERDLEQAMRPTKTQEETE